MAPPKDEFRQWQWVFRALWSAAPNLGLDPSAGPGVASTVKDLSSRRRRCQLHLLVPDTILFERGVPCKWVGCTADGTVVRKPFVLAPWTSGYGYGHGHGHMSSTTVGRVGASSTAQRQHPALAGRIGVRRHQSSPLESMNNVEAVERLDAVIAAFLSSAAALPTPPPEGTDTGNAVVCVARYNDGSTELLSEKSLRSLCAFHNWRASLCALQAYVRPAGQPKTVVGTYTWPSERREISRRGCRTGTRDGRPLEVQATIRSNSGGDVCGEHHEPPPQEYSQDPAPLPTPVASEVERKRGREANTVDDGASQPPQAFQVSAVAVNQATEDVAFVTDASYAWLGEPPPSANLPRGCSDTASKDQPLQDPEDSSDLADQKLANHAGANQSSDRSLLIVGAPTEYCRRRHPWPKSRVRVSRLEAEFVIDEGGRLWFTNVIKVLVQSVRRAPAKMADEVKHRLHLKRAKEEAVLASSVAARELRAVVGLASRRGLNAEEIFRHFMTEDENDADVNGGRGALCRAGKKEILQGMAGLGISLSEEAAICLIETILRSRAGSPATLSKHSTITTGSLGDSAEESQSMVSSRVGSTPGAYSETSAARGKPGSSWTLSAERLGNASLSPSRQYVTAEDLWTFAHRELGYCPTTPGVIAKDPSNDRVQHIAGQEEHTRPSSSSQEIAEARGVPSPNRRAREDLDRSPKRRRIRNVSCTRLGGSVSRTTGMDRMSSEKLHSFQAACQEHPSQACTTLRGETGGGRSARKQLCEEKHSSNDIQERHRNGQASLPRTPSFSAICDPGGAAANKVEHLPAGYDRGRRGRQSLTPIRTEGGGQDVGHVLESDQEPAVYDHNFSKVGGNCLSALAGWNPRAHEHLELSSFPCDDPAFEAVNGKDRVFHVDRGLVIAYRVLRNQDEDSPLRGPDNTKSPPPAVGASGAKDDASCSGPQFKSILMVVIPGLFQTLDTLEKALAPLLVAHHRLTMLLIAPPGMPNTHWPAEASLNGELTAKCVSTLLEHLLESGELLPGRNTDQSVVVRDEAHCGSTSHTDSDTGSEHLPAPAKQDGAGLHGMIATTREGDEDTSSSCGISTAVHPNAHTLYPSPSADSRAVFVGFGIGANSILHLATAPLRTICQPVQHVHDDDKGDGWRTTLDNAVGGVDGDRGAFMASSGKIQRVTNANGCGIHEQGPDPPIRGEDAKARDGLLVAMLRRHGIRAGGLILVNGFMTLDEQSTQVLHTLRQALCDQSDGGARSEAVASLLLSENHLATAPPQVPATPSPTATKSFLDTREAFRLDANVSALARSNTGGVRLRGRPFPVKSIAKKNTTRRRLSRPFPEKSGDWGGSLNTESVLREIGENDGKRKRRLLRRQRRRGTECSSGFWQRQGYAVATEASGGSDSVEEHPNEDLLGSDEDEVQGKTSDDDMEEDRPPLPRQCRNKPASGPSSLNMHDAGSRLALAASVSTLSGLLESSEKDRECGGGGIDLGLCADVGGGSVRGASSRILAAVKRSKLPLVMVQSTEDALIDSPLALILKKELLHEDEVLAESVLECLKPIPSQAASGYLVREDQAANPPSAGGEGHVAATEEGEGSLDLVARDKKDFKHGGEEEEGGDQWREKGLLAIHACWVKAGHDVLHERGPFMRGLLHKDLCSLNPENDSIEALVTPSHASAEREIAQVLIEVIYACHGQEAPSTQFPAKEQGPTDKTTNGTVGVHPNDSGIGVGNPSCGGDDKQPGVRSPFCQVDATAGKNKDTGEREQQQRANDVDPTSQEARGVTSPCERGMGQTAVDLFPRVNGIGGVVGDFGPADSGCLLGTSTGDLETDKGESEHHPPFCISGASAEDRGGGAAVDKAPRTASTATTAGGTVGSSSLSSTATSVFMGGAPKLIDFFNTAHERSRPAFREATEYIEKFREFDLDRAILEKGLGATGDNLAALDLPLLARYTFQTMKDCWRCKMLVVEAARLDLGMRKKQADIREQLALSIRTVNNMTRILRKRNNNGRDPGIHNSAEDHQSNVENNILHLEPLDQRALKIEIAAAEITRGTQYNTCRSLRRDAAVFRARRERLESTLAYRTVGVRGTLLALERIMGQLRKNITLARIQERVFHEEVVKADARGLKARRRLTVVNGKLTTLALHRHKWTDSDAWQPGYVQRLETAELIKILAAEGRKLQRTADAAESQRERARELHNKVSEQEAGLASTMEGVGALFSLLNSALEDESFAQGPEAAVDVQMALEHEILGSGDDLRRNKRGWRRGRRGRRQGPQDAAARVRATPHRSRTSVEKSWVALDAVVNPTLYHHVTAAEAEEMRWDALYYTRLEREDVLRIMSLPPQVQLALPFLHTPHEVAAHELLMRFSLSIDAEHFARLDKNSQDVSRSSTTASLSSCDDPSASLPGMITPGAERSNSATGSVPAGGRALANMGADGDLAGVTHRVLACMRRAAEAKLKISGERDEEESVWCVLDRKLRPDLYRDSDEAAADRNEVLHREADAREDARHAWLATSGDQKTAGNAGTTHNSRVAGEGTTLSSVVKQGEEAKDAAKPENTAQDHAATAAEAAESWSADYIRDLAAARTRGSLRGIENPANGNREAAQGLPTSPPNVVGVGNEILNADGAPEQNSSQPEGTSNGGGEKATSANQESNQPEQCRFHEDTVLRVLSHFLVAEEETPLGRDMTRSLAMLQEVALRLVGGKRNIFSGLNPHTALEAVRHRTLAAGDPRMSASPPDVDDGAPGSATSATTTATSKPAAAAATAGNDDGEGVTRQASTTGSVLIASATGAANRGMVTTPSSPDESAHKSGMASGNQPQSQQEVTPSLEAVPWLNNGTTHGDDSVVSGGGTSAMSDTPRLEKVYGSWEEVHPAALGIGSQEKEFSLQEDGGANREHPASFRRGASTGSSTLSSPLTASGFTVHNSNRSKSYRDIVCSLPLDPLEILTGEGRSGAVPGWLSCEASGERNLVASGMDKVGELDPGEVRRRGLLVASRERTCLLDVKTSELQAGQSKAYAFQVGPYDVSGGCSTAGSSVDGSKETCGRESDMLSAGSTTDTAKVVVGLAVTVVYQGNFEPEGYRLGRLAAGLYRMPPKGDDGTTPGGGNELPQPVGFAPYSLQALNTPDSIGRIMIFHQPRVQPVRAGRFQLVLGAASRVRYSISVVAVTAADALVAFHESVKSAQRLQKRLPSLLEDMEDLKAVSKLSRWKQRVVRELLEEAREEAVRCDGEINEVKREIQEEENDQKLDDEGRRALLAEARDLNAEISRWKMTFATRVQEGKDVRAGMETIQSKLRLLQDEEDDLRKKLAQARRSLPAAAFVLKDQREATDVALALNATVDKYSGAAARWAAADLLKERGDVILSPADRVRRALKEEGWDVLTMEERRFTMLDRVLRPDLYQWMKESRLNEEGEAVLAPEIPIVPKRRKDSLVTLIGAGPIGTKSLEGAENIEDAMQARKKQGWSKKATDFATPSAWSGNSKIALDGTGDAGTISGSVVGALTARSDATSAGALTARSGVAGVKSLTLADEWRLRDFSFTAMELEKVKATPFHRLQRKKLKARKLLARFHDDDRRDRRGKASAEKIAREAETRCAAVRAKDKALRTEEENEWVEIDKKLFPEVWRQKNRQEDRLRKFNMTLPSIPRPSTASEHGSDSEDDGKGDRNHLGGVGDKSGCGWRARREGDPGSRGSRWRSKGCPFDREEIIQIWASNTTHGGKRNQAQQQRQRTRGEDLMADREDDVLRVRELLLSFNGPFTTFAREAARRNTRQRGMDGNPLTLSTSSRIAYCAAQQSQVAAAYARDHADLGRPPGSARGPGPDETMIALLRELMTAKAIHSKYMDTNVAHGTAQRFSTEHYAKELEREIAAQLREQILERERAMAREASDLKHEEASVSESSDDEAENWESGGEVEAILADKNKSAGVSYREGERVLSSAHTPGAKNLRRRESNGGHAHGGHPSRDPETKFPRRNGGNGGEFSHASVGASNGPSAPKHGGGSDGAIAGSAGAGESWHDLPLVQEFTQDEVNDLVYDDPAWEGCRACRTIPCRWCSCVDYRSVGARKAQIRDELFRLMGLWDEDEVVTAVPLSCVRGGPTTLLRTEAVSELRWEAKELDRQLHLAAVDKELHDAYACMQDAVEVQSLHEYSTLMWTKDAQVALSKERELTLARTTSQEVVDDLLEAMLDGWAFGERQGEHAAGGIIPAVKKSGALRPGDQRRAVAYLEHRHRLRRIAHAKGERLPEEVKGTQHTKALPIDDIAQRRILDGRTTKRKEDQNHLLRETETTMKFGLFSMVQSYLHAMTLVQREKESWSGKGDAMTREGKSSVARPPLTSERKKMIEEAVKARQRAATRKKFFDRARKAEDRSELREAKNKRRVSQRKAMRILEIRERDKAARNIQRVFRGFRGKVFAQRWALKRAEVEALKSVLHEAAVNVQRAFRGHLGRVEASEMRMELAEYIADIRVKEAESDIADFWETHRLKATKDELKKTLLNTIGKPLVAMRRKRLE